MTVPVLTGHHQYDKPCLFSTNQNFFKLNREVKRTIVLTKFHLDGTCDLKSVYKVSLKPYRENLQPLGGHVIRRTISNTFLTKFHKDWAMNVTSRALIRKTASPPSILVLQPTGTIFELRTHVLTKFH
ncbi:hypothetical protein DPMN_083807 [Dreissena polymorpha]|uniref:Uncharacterized protein n=1 Tax=Dreissena polymorpha TaxID=45954 RepID=A0A9D3YD74_DREPO|nr:hypothetical protein DPMN_083807 [Dreissena polymorpha]